MVLPRVTGPLNRGHGTAMAPHAGRVKNSLSYVQPLRFDLLIRIWAAGNSQRTESLKKSVNLLITQKILNTVYTNQQDVYFNYSYKMSHSTFR
jgi:hypothetical protein